MATRHNAVDSAKALFDHQLKQQIRIPVIDMAANRATDISDVLRDLDRLRWFIDGLETNPPYATRGDNSLVCYSTPLGLVLHEIGEWVKAQSQACFAALEAMVPADRGNRSERLVALISDAIARDQVDRFFGLAEEYRELGAAVPTPAQPEH